jgi:NAD(P)-dependent dehydrogenase (short-subunit alcohol dehydrogenase family)
VTKKMQRTSVITGALGGIGSVLCKAFTDAGYRVLATDREQGSCSCDEFFREDIKNFCDENSRLAAFVEHCANFTRDAGLNVLINNAAVQILNHVQAISLEQWKETLETNLLAPFFLTKSLLPQLIRAHGSVVNIASIHAVSTKPRFVAYATSKAALVGLTRAMAIDLGPKLRVNAISPAAVATPMLLSGFEESTIKLAELSGKHPLGRIATAEEVAQAALFLASEAASFISGVTLSVDGGIGARLHDPD